MKFVRNIFIYFYDFVSHVLQCLQCLILHFCIPLSHLQFLLYFTQAVSPSPPHSRLAQSPRPSLAAATYSFCNSAWNIETTKFLVLHHATHEMEMHRRSSHPRAVEWEVQQVLFSWSLLTASELYQVWADSAETSENAEKRNGHIDTWKFKLCSVGHFIYLCQRSSKPGGLNARCEAIPDMAEPSETQGTHTKQKVNSSKLLPVL